MFSNTLHYSIALLASFVLISFLSQSAYAFESCDEACPAMTESGTMSYIDSSDDSHECCCLRDSDTVPFESRPLDTCN